MTKKQEREEFIAKSMRTLEISIEEAEELWAFDHDEIENEEADALTEKNEKKSAPKRSSLEKVKNMKAVKKADERKSEIIAMIFDHVKESALTIYPQEMSATKMSFMDTDGSYYSVAITKHKAKPDGFEGLKEKKVE